MGKVVLVPVLLVAACIIAGLYGVLHDQVSYTVSSDYYHGFKFRQFDIPADLHNRVGAAIVGWAASWWTGLIVGVPIVLVGLVIPGWRAYARHCLVAFGVVAATAFAVGLGALAYASLTISDLSVAGYWSPGSVADRVALERAGMMHNFSYLGGFLGIVTGTAYLAIARARQPAKSPSSPPRPVTD